MLPFTSCLIPPNTTKAEYVADLLTKRDELMHDVLREPDEEKRKVMFHEIEDYNRKIAKICDLPYKFKKQKSKAWDWMDYYGIYFVKWCLIIAVILTTIALIGFVIQIGYGITTNIAN